MAIAVSPADTERFVAELHQLDVRHLMRLDLSVTTEPMAIEDLLAALAQHPEARLRASLILLFLRRPKHHRFVDIALHSLRGEAADTLRLYYQAAVYLQHELEPELRPHVQPWETLPDQFSAEFNLPAASTVAEKPAAADAALAALGEVHRRLSGRNLNWAGSYRQHVGLFLRQLSSGNGLKWP